MKLTWLHRFFTLALFIGASAGSQLYGTNHIVVCVPQSDALTYDTDKSLACYYDYGYLTAPGSQHICYIRFDKTAGNGVELASWNDNRIVAKQNSLPTYYNKCRTCFPTPKVLIFSQPSGVNVPNLATQERLTPAGVASAIGASVTYCNGGGAAQCAKAILGSSMCPQNNP